MIQCDTCLVWQHMTCMGIDEPPDEEDYFCEQCRPDLHLHLLKCVSQTPTNPRAADERLALPIELPTWSADLCEPLSRTEEEVCGGVHSRSPDIATLPPAANRPRPKTSYLSTHNLLLYTPSVMFGMYGMHSSHLFLGPYASHFLVRFHVLVSSSRLAQ